MGRGEVTSVVVTSLGEVMEVEMEAEMVGSDA